MQPVLDRISSWNNGCGLIYKCPSCEVSFGFYGDEEKYCHHCGAKIDWDNIPRYCSVKTSNLYHNAGYEKQKAIINEYNRLIREKAVSNNKEE